MISLLQYIDLPEVDGTFVGDLVVGTEKKKNKKKKKISSKKFSCDKNKNCSGSYKSYEILG
jgi:hypothetical protein